MPPRLALSLLAIAALGLPLSPAIANATPFTPELEADYAYAEQWWGGAQPIECTSLTKEVRTEEEIEARGRIVRSNAGERHDCFVYIAEGLETCEQREVVIHEYGHLIGLEHDDDPNSIMYGGGTHGVLCVPQREAEADAAAQAASLAAFEERKATFLGALAREARRCRKIKRPTHRRECWRGYREERKAKRQLIAYMEQGLTYS